VRHHDIRVGGDRFLGLALAVVAVCLLDVLGDDLLERRVGQAVGADVLADRRPAALELFLIEALGEAHRPQ
jgi:hypothetical protein